jgi:hypothetical protein
MELKNSIGERKTYATADKVSDREIAEEKGLPSGALTNPTLHLSNRMCSH